MGPRPAATTSAPRSADPSSRSARAAGQPVAQLSQSLTIEMAEGGMVNYREFPKPPLTCANTMNRHRSTRPGGSENRKVGGSTPPLATVKMHVRALVQ